MQEEYGKLQAQKEALYADYGKLKKQVKEYDVIKQNIDSILRQGKEPEREKERNGNNYENGWYYTMLQNNIRKWQLWRGNLY